MDKRILLGLVFLTYLIHEAWTLLANNTVLLKPFPFTDQSIYLYEYIFLASGYAIWLILMIVIYQLFEGYEHIMKWFVFFQIAEFIEYFLTYNNPLFFAPNPINPVINLFKEGSVNFDPIGINITNIKIVVMFVILSKSLLWKPGKQ